MSKRLRQQKLYADVDMLARNTQLTLETLGRLAGQQNNLDEVVINLSYDMAKVMNVMDELMSFARLDQPAVMADLRAEGEEVQTMTGDGEPEQDPAVPTIDMTPKKGVA